MTSIANIKFSEFPFSTGVPNRQTGILHAAIAWHTPQGRSHEASRTHRIAVNKYPGPAGNRTPNHRQPADTAANNSAAAQNRGVFDSIATSGISKIFRVTKVPAVSPSFSFPQATGPLDDLSANTGHPGGSRICSTSAGQPRFPALQQIWEAGKSARGTGTLPPVYGRRAKTRWIESDRRDK